MRLSAQAGNRRRAVDAKSHGRPVGKPLRHPIWVSGCDKRVAATVCVTRAERPVHAERAEAGPGRESSAESIGPKPEVGKRKRTNRPTR